MDTSTESARLPTPAGRTSIDGGPVAPVGRDGSLAHLLRRMRESAWAPVLARGLGISAGMLALAGIGAFLPPAKLGTQVGTAAAAPLAVPAATTSGATSAGATTPDVATPPAASASTAAPAPSAGVTADGKVVLNEATAEELLKLPRVGPKRAQAIIEMRRRLGRFHQPTDLLRVKGIGRKTLRLMLPLVVVDDAARKAAQ